MKHEALVYEKFGAVAVVTFNRPFKGNAIDVKIAQALNDTCTEIGCDSNIHVLVITGSGEKAFSIGLEHDKLIATDECLPETDLLSVVTPVASLAIPVIAAINGDALGQGLELALACDIRIAVGSARFGFPQIASGSMPRDGGTQRLPRLIGRGKAMEMLLTGQSVDAAEAYRIGLVSKVVRQEELMPAAMDIAQSLASRAPLAVRYGKEAVLKGMDLTLEQGLRLEADLYFLLQTTRDRAEGIKAFLEKRSPKFKGT
jgi:enoyl-CoA hydratase